MVDEELSLADQLRQIETQRGHIAGEVARAFLEAEEHAGLAELPRAVDEEAQSDEGLAGAGAPADERRAPGGQSAAGYLVQAADAGRDFAEVGLENVDRIRHPNSIFRSRCN